MDKYKGIDCPICNKPLDNGEVVAICPECGAPYHRECILKEGKCIYQDLHKEGKSWEQPKSDFDEHTENMESRRCSRCGTLNDSSCIFCEVCGTSLNNNQDNQENTNNNFNQQRNNQPNNFMAYDPFNNPFGGVDADDTIDDIPVKDWAIYIGQNTYYFIPKFKRMSMKQKGTTFNFASAIFGGFYYLYRKMYLWGVILLLINLLISLPSVFLRVGSVLAQISPEIDIVKMFTSSGMVQIANICSILNIVLFLATGILTNKLYSIHCKNNIKKIMDTNTTKEGYLEKLNKKGGVSKKLIPILLISYLILSLVSSLILVLQL